jgi:urease accessory protein
MIPVDSMIIEPPALLNLLAWLSPAFPTGAYAYSHGLEWAVEAGDVRDGASLEAWLTAVLDQGSARGDAILLRAAHREGENPARLAELAELAAALAPASERRAETLAQGAAFAAAAAPWGGSAPVALPVSLGMLAARHGIPEDAATLAYLQAFIANLISAAVRLVPLGQSTGQAVLAALGPAILATAGATESAGLADLGSSCLRADIAAMRHETQYTRLFRS